ncbi:putative reverse transcriptase domain-containing protein [Tanacetum coccineum]
MMNPRRRGDRNGRGSEGEESENPFVEGGDSSSDEQPDRPRRNQREDNRCWKSRIRANIPEFNGNTLNLKGFIDWLVAVEEVFEFKEVPENKRVLLIATKLRGGSSGSGNVTSQFVPNQTKVGGGNIGPVSKGVGSSGLKFFNYGEHGHRQSECKKAGKRHLFADEEWEDDGMADDDYEEPLVFDDEPYEEEVVSGDVGVNLMVRRSCLTPKAVGNDWLKHNIFQSTCTILGKVCTFVVDLGSYDNLIAEEAVQKLGLETENHSKPYKLQWLKKGGEVTISKHVLVTFSIGTTYKDNIWCDVVPIDACHLLLGRPWEYDHNTTHNERANTYSFLFGCVKITLMPNKPKELVNKPMCTLLTLLQFQDELEMEDVAFMLIRKEVSPNSEIHEAMFPLLEEFSNVFLDELPDGLPPLRDIQHHINLEPAKKIGPLKIVEKINSNAYRLKLPSHIRYFDVFKVKHLLPYHGDSSDDDLVVNSRANFVSQGQ